MDVFVTGGTGFLGRALCQRLIENGHQVTVLSRSAEAAQRLPRGVGAAIGDPTVEGSWQEEVTRCQGVVNLAGASIFGRWTKARKELITESRLLTTRNLVWALPERPEQETVLVSASAVGYYGPSGDEQLDETAPPGKGFLAQVCQDWEAEAQAADAKKTRVVRTRFGIVLGAGGGALEQMLPLFRKGLGGPLGSGRQWFSWIHRSDLVDAIVFCLENSAILGPVNLTSPQPVTNAEFTRALGQVLDKPTFLKAPGFAVRLFLGEFGSVLLTGQRVLPRVLEKAGFEFSFADLSAALADLLVERA